MKDMINKKSKNKNEKVTRDVFVSENCSVCGREIFKVSDILVDVDTDKYICRHCAEQNHEITTSECGYLYSEKEI